MAPSVIRASSRFRVIRTHFTGTRTLPCSQTHPPAGGFPRPVSARACWYRSGSRVGLSEFIGLPYRNSLALSSLRLSRCLPKLPMVAILPRKSLRDMCRPAPALFCLAYCLLGWLFAFPLVGAAQNPEKSDLPAHFDLLETKVRFESSGDSRKEVHAIVKIHSELGVRQFASLTFDFNRSFQSVAIPLVRITHAGGGTADMLPSAISDNPNPVVLSFHAYQDVRVKSVRILGLAPGDTLEYRVVTTTTHHPLAPDFWLDHSFDRTGVVSHELFELDLPADRKPQVQMAPAVATRSSETDSRLIYRWDSAARPSVSEGPDAVSNPDIVVTSFGSWREAARRLGREYLDDSLDPAVTGQSRNITASLRNDRDRAAAVYYFVAQKIRTVDLQPRVGSMPLRPPADVLSSGYGSAEDKMHLLCSMIRAIGLEPGVAFPSEYTNPKDLAPSLSALSRVVGNVSWNAADKTRQQVWLDPALEVAPFGLVRPDVRGKPALHALGAEPGGRGVAEPWTRVSAESPFPASQIVRITSTLDAAGTLNAKVKYSIRGENELVLRLAFHQSPQEKWAEVAQLLALSDGFRGKVTSVNASDPYATRDPFTVEYEITQPKFVDWSKSPVRVPAILPLVGLPDAPLKSGASLPGTAPGPVELGTPLDVHTSVTLHLPPGTTVESPAGTNVERDYATFSSSYSASGTSVTAARHIHFIARELPADRASDYNAFVHAVQNDQAQRFTLLAPPLQSPPVPPTASKRAVGSR
jgi:hypothetical protein